MRLAARMVRALSLANCLVALPAGADPVRLLPQDPDAAAFVRANIISTLYHEVGHALIDVLDLAVIGQEEDAADTLSALLVDRFWQEAAAEALIRETAEAYLLYDAQAEAGGFEQPYWDTHSLDLQRYYNLVCLFYGANPDARAGLADDLGLPEERRESCPEEFQLANDSWGAMLQDMPPQDHGPGLRLVVPQDRDDVTALIAEELQALYGEYGLPSWIDVTVESCGEANAFYDPRARRIVICTEFAAELARLYAEAAE